MLTATQPSDHTTESGLRCSRRDLLLRGVPALAGAALVAPGLRAASPPPSSEVAWPDRRRQIERAWLDLMGEFPTEVPPLRPTMKQVAIEQGIIRYHVTFQSEADDRVTGWLLVPESALKTRTPAIICIHSTTFGSGKDSTVGLAGRRPVDPPGDPETGRAYGLNLARHGFVTLSIDLLTDGERIQPGDKIMDTRPFYRKHPDWSIVGKNTWDIMRSVDFLQTLDFVDGANIGSVGWSLGGHTVLFAAAFDPRINATVTNGGVLDWHRATHSWGRPDDLKNSPELERRFGFKPNSGPYIYLKRFRPYIADPSKPIPVDFDSLMMMVAPRPLLVISSEWEFYSHKVLPKCLEALKVYLNWKDSEGLPSVVAARQARRGYDKTLEYYQFNNKIPPEKIPGMLRQLGAGDCFSWFSFPGGHSYPREARQLSFAWFDRWLGRTPTA
ncbi:MAG: acetylxylan esterase [Opitutaceae bacterium]|nr:acetylxylan esterase [Opitutaceae bacterium]